MTNPGADPRTSAASIAANRHWWDLDARAYHAEHGTFLGVDRPGGAFIWCPEALDEADWHLLGPLTADSRVLEMGCGSAPCARWVTNHTEASCVAFDLSRGMLEQGLAAMRADPAPTPLLHAEAEQLPFTDAGFDVVFSAFGAIPFVAYPERVMAEVFRVLRPGGRLVFSVTHPMRWIFLDDPGVAGLTAVNSYFDRTPYSERDADGALTYVEHHRTLGDRVRDLRGAGLTLEDIIEPQWPEWLEATWGQWSPTRGEIFPGTAIFVATKPESAAG